ncbi:MAG TPA: VOC family protein [Gemmatimonadota bacterium]|nr:VOC family protein [Gemmatimonadota bacterium]
MKKLTPLLAVEAIEPSLAFWVDALGFARTVEVPHEDALGFVILEKDGYEVMMQTIASIKSDVPAAVPPAGASLLYIEVEDLSAIEEAIADYELLVPRRKTFYGAEEIFVREPGGNVVGFAEYGADEEG